MASRLSALADEIAASIDLAELSERLGIPIKRSGRTVKAQCQFHDDNDPSAFLYDRDSGQRQHYHCFVCNERADIFRLTQKRKNLNFFEALDWLAQTYSLKARPAKKQSTSTGASPETSAKVGLPESQNGFDLAWAMYLQTSNKENLNSWLQSRRFDPSNDALKDVLHAKRNALTNTATANKSYGEARVAIGRLEDAQLVLPGRANQDEANRETHLNLGGAYRDFFFDERIVFPIRNKIGDIVGFAGRKLDTGGTAAKYLYTPGLPKGQILYGADKAFSQVKQSITPASQYVTLFVCEGLLDTIRLQSLGFAAVGLLGAHLSDGQCELLMQFGQELPERVSIRLMVFLDKDKAGLKGAANLIKKIFSADEDLRFAPIFIWPNVVRSLVAEPQSKDPDEFLQTTQDPLEAAGWIDSWSYPPAIAVLANDLGVLPQELLDDELWKLISLSRRFQVSLAARKLVHGVVERLLQTPEIPQERTGRWRTDFIEYLTVPGGAQPSGSRARPIGINDDDARLNLARELAESGVRRGELPTDVAAWRRLNIGATAFNEGLRARLRQRNFLPLEPFDAVHVSRGFGKDEPRLKAIACPEELIAQQYLINELLSERLDTLSDAPFSSFIPAVRFYASSKSTVTTGEGAVEQSAETLSFAYQIDMDVLEGRQPAGESGMFRPYFDCWRDFVQSITNQSSKMTQVHMVRLDVRKYYDSLKKSVVRNALRLPIDRAFESLPDKTEFAPWFRPMEQENERQQAVLDWLLDQSFGFKYYDPASGAVTSTPSPDIGIPQGPVLSAWLASVALFPMDQALRAQLGTFNADGQIRAGYARYVDDIVLVADSSEVLGVLRAAAQDAARVLQLELVAKELAGPMSSIEFNQHVTNGRALAVSGPIEEIALLPVGDGDVGWYALNAEPPKRYAALQLLRDQSLYACSPDRLLDQIGTALRSEELRPSELGKAARWLWYWASSQVNDGALEPLFEKYWMGWSAVTAGTAWVLDPTLNAWDDPAFYALEGVDRLLESAHWGEEFLSHEENQARIKAIARVAKAFRKTEFIDFLQMVDIDLAPLHWGYGTGKLSRMFLQRALAMRWKAVRLVPWGELEGDYSVLIEVAHHTNQIKASLRRALLTDAETCNKAPITLAQRGEDDQTRNALREGIIWLHDAFVRLGAKAPALPSENGPDPLTEIGADLDEISARANGELNEPHTFHFLNLLRKFKRGDSGQTRNGDATIDQVGALQELALAAFVAICPRDRLIALLADREHMLPSGVPGTLRLIVPPLPGVAQKGFIATLTANEENRSDFINHIQWFTATGQSTEEELTSGHTPPLYRSTSTHPPVKLPLLWRQTNEQHLTSQTAEWNAGWPAKILIAPTTPSPSVGQLRWAADAYEALARLNYEVQQTHADLEVVAAWPYLVVSRWSEDMDSSDELSISLLSSLVPVSKVKGNAFIRDGSRGLTTYEVPDENGNFWRAGVTLSDVLGFIDELDKYSALEVPEVTKGNSDEAGSPDRHLLRNVLRKLRGHYGKNAYMPRHRNKPYIPATLDRSLQLLRNYPEDANPQTGMLYVLSCEMETRAMATRLADGSDLNRAGGLSDFLARSSRDVCRRIPLAWSEFFPSTAASEVISPARASSHAWIELAERLKAIGEFDNLSWKAFQYGLHVEAISDWLRSIALELHANSNDLKWRLPERVDGAALFGFEDPILCKDSPVDDYAKLSQRFVSALDAGYPQQAFDFITPLGWFFLAAGRVGLLDVDDFTSHVLWSDDDRRAAQSLASFLAARAIVAIEDDGVRNELWPFEHLNGLDVATDDSNFARLRFLKKIDSHCGLRIDFASGTWSFKKQERQFTDAKGETWSFPSWRVGLTDGFDPEQFEVAGRISRHWTEVRDENGRLVGVSARGKRMASLLGARISKVPVPVDPVVTSSMEVGTNSVASPLSGVGREPVRDIPAASSAQEDEGSLTKPPSDGDEQSKVSAGSENIDLTKSETAIDVAKVRQSWREMQSSVWSARAEKSDCHVRVAIMQWRVDDSYRHPIYDIANPKFIDSQEWKAEQGALHELASAIAKDTSYKKIWKTSESVPSWAEFRRRRFLDEALRACLKFDVDVLVLPEYSVRPETVGWLRQRISEQGAKLSVVAGTYRIFGNYTENGFVASHQEILGLADLGKLIPTGPAKSIGPPNFYERSAMLTMIAPITYNGRVVVSTYSRSKKYPSNAAEEIIRPNTQEWEPLFSTSKMLDELAQRDSSGNRTRANEPLPANVVVPLISKTRHLHYFAELICSELFLPMSPINYSGLAGEYRRLTEKFGFPKSKQMAVQDVIQDVEALARYLGPGPLDGDLYRRTILLVPAMSGRSADYWCFGQSAILAGGVTTVFCNAVADKQGVGGSCFIGRKSWEFGRSIPGIQPHVTPYNGWSRGVFYNSADDALGAEEQAVVIADIDPMSMNEGKPRQQALQVPLQLVAYLPIAETLQRIPSNKEKVHISADAWKKQPQFLSVEQVNAIATVKESLERISASRVIVQPSQISVDLFTKEIPTVLGDAESAFSKRLKHWETHWRDQPQAGIPPALVDWLWIDVSPVESSTYPTLFVPPWSESDEATNNIKKG